MGLLKSVRRTGITRRKLNEIERLLAEHEEASDQRDALLNEVDKKLDRINHLNSEIDERMALILRLQDEVEKDLQNE